MTLDKKQRLVSLAEKVISEPKNIDEINYLLSNLKLTKDEVIEAYVNWDLDPDIYDNKIYDSLALRFAMYLHYLLPGSWHQERQNETIKLLNNYPNSSIVDLGFGAPQGYVKDVVLNNNYRLSLLDIYDSALIFSRVLLSYWNSNWEDKIELRKYNMDSSEHIGDYDIYLFQDSIEHTKDPTKYLSDLVKKAPNNSRFIFSLPIEGEVVASGSHFITWRDENHASQWLDDCGLNVVYSKSILMNPEVDLFADDADYYECLYECVKNKY